jgi:hypothetical protein
LKKYVENKTKVHYLSIETKISTTIHKQHYEIHFEFRPWDGCQMVNIEFLILYYSLKFELKCNQINNNKVYSFKSIYNYFHNQNLVMKVR